LPAPGQVTTAPRALPKLILDYCYAWRAQSAAPMSVDDRAADIGLLCGLFGTWTVYCDQFSFVPLQSIFARHGIQLLERPWTASSKAPKYRKVRDAMAEGRVRLIDDGDLVREFHSIQ